MGLTGWMGQELRGKGAGQSTENACAKSQGEWLGTGVGIEKKRYREF